MNIQEQVDHLIDTRPGKELLTAVYDDPASEVADGIFRSGGNTAAYMLLTDTVASSSTRAWATRRRTTSGCSTRSGPDRRTTSSRPRPTSTIVGGVDLFKEPGTIYVAQANNPACQRDDARIRELRMRTAGIWFDMLGTDAKRIYKENPGVSMAQSEPTPDLLVDRRLDDQRRRSAHGAASPRSARRPTACVVWLPEQRIALVSNLFGPLFPHFPNLNTIRGDKYRFVEPQLATNRMVRELRPEVLVTGRHEPIVGADLIDACLERLHDAVDYVHTRTLEGINAGIDVWTLMREITLPPNLRVGQGYGKVSWGVRTIWEEYVGWFKLRSTTELYPDSAAAALAELVDAAGPDAAIARAQAALDRGDAVLAIRIAEAVPDDGARHGDHARRASASPRPRRRRELLGARLALRPDQAVGRAIGAQPL